MINIDLKNQIDTEITNKTAVNTITPINVGENMKDIVDYIDEQAVHKTGDENIEGQKTFEVQDERYGIVVDTVINNSPIGGIHVNNNGNYSGYIDGIVVDNGYYGGRGIIINNAITGNNALEINNESYSDAIKINNNGGVGIRIDNGMSDSDSPAIEISHDAPTTSAVIIFNESSHFGIDVRNDQNGTGIGVSNDAVSSTGTGLKIYSANTATGLFSTNSGSGKSFKIENYGTGNIIDISNENSASRPISYSKSGVDKMFMNADGEITAQKLIKSGGTSSQYLMADGSTTSKKVYKALLSQTGTSAPVAVILENTLGVVPTWSYFSTGQYNLTSTGLFTTTNTLVHITPDVFSGATKVGASSNLNNVSFRSYDLTNTPADSIWTRISVTIEVY